jgi:serine/threonine-protein kinase
VRTDPAPGTPLPSGGAVTLVLSRGAAPPSLPDVTGRKFSDAAKVLQKLGFDVVQDSGIFSSRDGRVQWQDPEPGARVPPGSTITLHTGLF